MNTILDSGAKIVLIDGKCCEPVIAAIESRCRGGKLDFVNVFDFAGIRADIGSIFKDAWR
jgi:hypothetical protein